ncbi:MAG: hypothetical protein K9I68_06465 [Bacteroidales bacterium]|nr:hypothetical protein [Bacteroidales bacterium]MCF8337007.1 hypothetical protein [Bacteroidales bacterium]
MKRLEAHAYQKDFPCMGKHHPFVEKAFNGRGNVPTWWRRFPHSGKASWSRQEKISRLGKRPVSIRKKSGR